MGSRQLSTEDGVEIDSSSCDDILPFGVWKLGTIWFVNERSLRCFGINCVGFNEFERLCERVSQHGTFVSST
jgi:hypothetical protein